MLQDAAGQRVSKAPLGAGCLLQFGDDNRSIHDLHCVVVHAVGAHDFQSTLSAARVDDGHDVFWHTQAVSDGDTEALDYCRLLDYITLENYL